MGSQTLAVKYRPKTFDDLCEQDYIKVILENQIKNNDIKHSYILTGPAGCGKTTIARIFANMINEGKGIPIEVDAASNNGVEQIRNIIEDAKFKPLDSKYKVFILDEVHMLSMGAWNALLKLLEEPPATAVFLMATTDYQKIPNTIKSRCQTFNFSKISQEGIVNRLKYIIKQENNDLNIEDEYIGADTEALSYIAKISEGGMRTAISNMEKCLGYSTNLTVENVVKALGISDYDKLSELLFLLCVGCRYRIIEIIEEVYNQGKDLKQFIKQFIQFILDVCKYLIYESYDYIQIPNNIDLERFKGNNIEGNYELLLNILDNIIELQNKIKYESNPKVLIEAKMLLLCKGE